MPDAGEVLRLSALYESTLPRFVDGIAGAEAAGVTHRARRYPGAARAALPRPRARLTTRFDAVVRDRRSARALSGALPDEKTLSTILYYGHGHTGPLGRGPAPSAGNLQPIHLYALSLAETGWLAGVHHYDREAHDLAELSPIAGREALLAELPSLAQLEGGALAFVLVGDTRPVQAKYGDRASRFLLLEAGHVMQSLVLAAASVGWCVVPVGGFLEGRLAARLSLPEDDAVLYAGILGEPLGGG